MKKTFKVLSTATLAAAFSAIALTPVVAAEVVDFNITDVVIEKDSVLYSISATMYRQMKNVDHDFVKDSEGTNLNPTYLVSNTGKNYSVSDFRNVRNAFPGSTAKQALEELNNMPEYEKEITSSKVSVEDGEVKIEDPELGLTVDSVMAINDTNFVVTAELTEAPEEAPTYEDFTVAVTVDGVAVEAAVVFAWDAETNKATFIYVAIEQTDADQVVDYSVAYLETAAQTGTLTVAGLADQLDALEVIQAYVEEGDASALTIAELEAAGVADANVDLLHLYKATLEAAVPIADLEALSTLITGVNTAAEVALEGLTETSTDVDLRTAGAKNVINSNVSQYQKAIETAQKDDGEIADLAELQELVNTVNQARAAAALAQIQLYAVQGDADALDDDLLERSLVKNVVEANIDAYKTSIAAADAIADFAALQSIIDAVNAEAAPKAEALATIKGFATEEDADELTIELLETAGVTDAKSENLALYKTRIAAADAIAHLTALKDVITLANTNASQAFASIQLYALTSSATNLTVLQLETIAIENANSYNLAEYKVAVADKSSISTRAEVQTIVNSVNASEATKNLVEIQSYATGSNAGSLTEQKLSKAGVTGYVESNLPAYKTAIAARTSITSLADLQSIITNINDASAFAVIQGYATGSDASLMDIAQLKAAGATGLIVVNIEQYQKAVKAKEEIANLPALQTIINNVNAQEKTIALSKINFYAVSDGVNAGNIVLNDLAKAGVEDAVSGNLPTYKAEIAKLTSVSSTEQLQAIVDAVNTKAEALETIVGYAAESDASDLTIVVLEAAGVTGLVATNLNEYKAGMNDDSVTDFETISKLQGFIDAVNALEGIKKYATSSNASALTIAQLGTARATDTVAANLSEYKTAIAQATSIADLSALDMLITNVNSANAARTALDRIKLYAVADDASALTFAELTTAGVTGALEVHLVEYKTAVKEAASIANLAALQVLVDKVNARHKPTIDSGATIETADGEVFTAGISTNSVTFEIDPAGTYTTGTIAFSTDIVEAVITYEDNKYTVSNIDLDGLLAAFALASGSGDTIQGSTLIAESGFTVKIVDKDGNYSVYTINFEPVLVVDPVEEGE
jgi:hypothetical protein